MDGYKLNKFAGAALLALLIIMGIREVNNAVVPDVELEQQAYVIEGVEVEAAAGAAPVEAAPVVSLAERLAVADAEAGAKVFKKCTQCHTIEPGGRHLQGPNLYDIVGAPVGGKEGFNYSAAVRDAGGVWDYEALDAWLKKPSDYIKRTKMVLALRKDKDRANVILYMRENGENPPALPEVVMPEAPAVEDAMPEEVAPAVEEAVEEAASAS